VSKPPINGTDWLRQHRNAAAAATTPSAPVCSGEDAIDSQVERFLQQHGVKYAPKTLIPIGLIDEKSSHGNQARDVPLVPESVERFAVSIRKGEYLPPIIVFPNGNRVTIVDGNNRHAGHKKAGSHTVPGFVIAEDTPSETIVLLTVAANNGHGVTPDLKWRKRQAVHLTSLGFTADKACEAAGITKAQLTDFKGLLYADARAKQHRIPVAWNDLPETSRLALGRIPLDGVFILSAHLVIDTGLDSKGTQELLRNIKACSSESEQVTFIAKLSEERKAAARARSATGNN